jgi:hypothetical protein
MNAIMQNKHIFKDKVVLDVGCGTAILSMYVRNETLPPKNAPRFAPRLQGDFLQRNARHSHLP